MAAGRAGELGARVTLIEKNRRLGLKLLITGGGRCNVTNSAGLKGFIAAFGRNGNFLYRAFSVFSSENLTGFLKSFGVPVRTDPDGKIFPADDKAQSVLEALHCFPSLKNIFVGSAPCMMHPHWVIGSYWPVYE